MDSDTPNRQRWCRIKDIKLVSRAKIYELAGEHEGLLVKLDDVSIVNVNKFDEIIANLPAAKIKPSSKRAGAAS